MNVLWLIGTLVPDVWNAIEIVVGIGAAVVVLKAIEVFGIVGALVAIVIDAVPVAVR